MKIISDMMLVSVKLKNGGELVRAKTTIAPQGQAERVITVVIDETDDEITTRSYPLPEVEHFDFHFNKKEFVKAI
jgi:hypothetical protein